MHASHRSRRNGQAKERRTLIADEARVIHPIEYIERIHFDCERWPVIFFGSAQREVTRPTQIKLRETRPLQRIAPNARRTIQREAVAVVVASRGQRIWRACIESDRRAEFDRFQLFSKKVEVLSVQMESIVSDLIAKCYYGRTGSEEGRPLRSTVPANAPLV